MIRDFSWPSAAKIAEVASAIGRDLAGLVGLGMIVHGVDLWSHAAAWIVGGGSLLGIVVVLARRS